ncbi:MAG: hypothetical protein PWP23_1951 [Candidatus Sumerlaeota bacterium]|nr:hypothetical protein [Candidatus Sumerlaeota bacterium]
MSLFPAFRRSPVLLFALLTALVLAGGCARQNRDYRLVRAPQPGDAMPVHVYQLRNGLMVYLTENHEEPRFYAEIAVRAGSKNDPPTTTGLAHYLEHLLFKGTENLGTTDYEAEKVHLDRITELYEEHFREEDPERRKEIYAEINREAQLAAAYAVPNEFDTIYKSFGATDLNAHTWREETVYKVALPSNRLRQWAVMETERFARPVFRLFHTELETVYEEKNRAMDNKDRLIFDAVNAALFKNHPYGQQTTLGDAEHLKRPSLVNIRNYYDTWYVPNNMAIAISGDIDVADTIALISEQFNQWERKPVPEQKKWEEEPLEGAERVEVTYPGEEYVLLAFRTAPRNSRDAAALRILDMILDNANAGLINLNLNQAQRVRSAGSYPMQDNDYGTQYLWGIPKADQSLEEVEQLLLDQIAILREGKFEDWILPAIVTDFRKSQEAQLEQNTGRVAMMRDAFLAYEDWDKAAREIEEYENVTRDDIVRVANEYFGGGYVAGYRRDGKNEFVSIEKPAIDPLQLVQGRESDFGRMLKAMPVKEIEPVYVTPGEDYRVTGKNTARTIYHTANPLNSLFTLQIIVEKGSDHDNRLGLATRLLDRSGTARLSAEELQKEWYKLGTDFGITAGASETVITLSGLDENFEPSLDLMREVLSSPVPAEGTLDELKKIVLDERADEMKDPQSISRALYSYNRYGADSPYLRRMTSKEIEEADEETLLGLVTELPRYRHTVAYTGTLALDDVEALLAEHLPVAADPIEPPPYYFRSPRAVSGDEVYFIDQETAQSQVRIESIGPEVDEARSTPSLIYNSYFAGGLSGIVYQELRESRGLVYFAGALYATGNRTGEPDIMLGALGCQADKTAEATAALLDITENLPVQPERFERTIASLDSRYRTSRLGFREVIGAVRAWERLGLEPDPRRARFEQLHATQLDDLLAFQNEYVAGKPRLVSIVGDSKRIDMDAVKQFGAFHELDVTSIFPE